MTVRVLIAAAASAALLSAAQAASAAPRQSRDFACPGGLDYSVVTWSEVKPGQLDLFKRAVVRNMDWYSDHGYAEDRFEVRPVDAKDHPGKTWFLTVHRNLTETTLDEHDAAWRAFVADYRASSVVRREQLLCLPADGAGGRPVAPALPR